MYSQQWQTFPTLPFQHTHTYILPSTHSYASWVRKFSSSLRHITSTLGINLWTFQQLSQVQGVPWRNIKELVLAKGMWGHSFPCLLIGVTSWTITSFLVQRLRTVLLQPFCPVGSQSTSPARSHPHRPEPTTIQSNSHSCRHPCSAPTEWKKNINYEKGTFTLQKLSWASMEFVHGQRLWDLVWILKGLVLLRAELVWAASRWAMRKLHQQLSNPPSFHLSLNKVL